MEGTYDTIRIEYAVHTVNEALSIRDVVPSIWINGERLYPGFTIDMRHLVASMRGSGQYDIFTCSCGEPGCAGIWEGIVVLHWPNSIRWLIPLHYDDEESKNEEDETVLAFKDKWFRKTDYLQAVSSAMETVRNIVSKDPGKFITVPEGFSIEALLGLQID